MIGNSLYKANALDNDAFIDCGASSADTPVFIVITKIIQDEVHHQLHTPVHACYRYGISEIQCLMHTSVP